MTRKEKEKWKNISSKPLDLKFMLDNKDYLDLLKTFMAQNEYGFIKPKDKTVYYNEDLLYSKEKIDWLKKNYFLNFLKMKSVY